MYYNISKIVIQIGLQNIKFSNLSRSYNFSNNNSDGIPESMNLYVQVYLINFEFYIHLLKQSQDFPFYSLYSHQKFVIMRF